MNQPSSRSLRTTWPPSISHWMASVISSSPRAEGRMARTASWMVWSNRYTPTRARSEAGTSGFSTSRTTWPVVVELGHAEALRIGNPGQQDLGDRSGVGAGEGGRHRCLTLGLEAVDERLDALADEVVAEVHDEVVGAEKVPGDEHAVGQSERLGLVQVGDLEAPAGAVSHRGHDLFGGVADDDADLLDAGLGHRLQAVEQDGLVGHRHQLLGTRVGDRSETGAGAPRQDQRFHRAFLAPCPPAACPRPRPSQGPAAGRPRAPPAAVPGAAPAVF